MEKIIAVANQKGGAGKTTTTIHIGAGIAALGKKVLILDMDPQGHIAEAFGYVAEDLQTEISDVLEGSQTIDRIIIPNVRPNLDIGPSNIRLSDMELTLVNLRFREYKLRKAIEPIVNLYDYIFIDCPPNLGLLTINALMTANYVLIPMATEFASMLGVSLLIKTVDSLKNEANQNLSIMGIIHTRNKSNTLHSKQVIEQTKMEIGDRIKIFEPPVNDSVRFTEAFGMGKTVYEVAPDIPGASAYQRIAEEILHA